MPFDLCNALGTFQSYINNSLHEYLDVFCIMYLNNMLVYSPKEEKHIEHVLKILKRLQDHGLQVNVDKYEFSVKKMKYLSLIISTDGISMDLEKVQAILNWKTPNSVKDVQAFLEFSNFYRQFVEQFSQCIKLLTKLTKKKAVQHKIWKEMGQIPLVWMDQGMSEDLQGSKTCIYHGTGVSSLQCNAGDVGEDRLFRFCDNKCALTDAQWHAPTGSLFFEEDVTSGVQLYDLLSWSWH